VLPHQPAGETRNITLQVKRVSQCTKNFSFPLDGSKVAEALLPYARFLAAALELAVDLIHVNDPETVAPCPMPGADYLKEVAGPLPSQVP
jgi:hypothetical protein